MPLKPKIMENHEHHKKEEKENHTKLAISATLHCLIGCGIGEIVGMVIGTALGWDNIPRIILAVLLGFVFGFILGMYPLLKNGFSFWKAFKIVFIAESLSIAVMETAEVLTEVYTPGVMDAGLTSWVFWAGMLFALFMGFLAAFPINFYLIKRGVRHQH